MQPKQIMAMIAFYTEANKRGDVVGQYVKASVHVDVICKHGHNYKVKPNNYMNGKRCAKCVGQSTEVAKEKFISALNIRNDAIMLGDYINSTTKVLLMCRNVHEYKISPSKYRNGRGCPKCSGHCSEQSKLNFYSMVSKRGETLVGKFVKSSKRVELICGNGHEYSISPNNYRNGKGCPVCSGQNQRQAYINIICDDGVNIALKFGIAAFAEERLKHQKYNNKNFEINQIGVWYFPTVKACKDAEYKVKTTLPCGVLKAKDFPDGYTETTNILNFELIKTIYENYGGVQIKEGEM